LGKQFNHSVSTTGLHHEGLSREVGVWLVILGLLVLSIADLLLGIFPPFPTKHSIFHLTMLPVP